MRAPGCRVSFTSYIASMLMPTVIRDLKLGEYGLRMIACDPDPHRAGGRRPDHPLVGRWNRAQPTKFAASPRAMATPSSKVDRKLKKLAAYLQPFFLEPPPDLAAARLGTLSEALRLLKRFRRIRGSEMAEMIKFLTGSLGEFLDRHFEAEETKRMFLANNVYGKHGGPYEQGSAVGLLFHLLAGGDDKRAGLQRPCHRGHGRHHPGDCRLGARFRRRDRDRCAGRPHPCGKRARGRRGAGRRTEIAAADRCSPMPIPSAPSLGWSRPSTCRKISAAISPRSRWRAPPPS